MKLLVTGGTGFSGAHVLRACLATGDEVASLYRADVPPPTPEDVCWLRADLLDARRLEDAIREIQPQGAIHLAGRVGIRPGDDPALLYSANVVGTVNLLEALARYTPACRTVVVGSAAQYGVSVQPGQPITERLPLEPRTHYGASKAAQERAALLFAYQERLPVLATRTFNLIGPGTRAYGLIPKVLQHLAQFEQGSASPPLTLGSLQAVRDLIDVRDAARAYRLLVDRGAPGEAYNVCSGRPNPVRAVVQQLVEKAGFTDTILNEEPTSHRIRHDTPWAVGNPQKIRNHTGWQPEIPLSDTLDQLIADQLAKRNANLAH